jgi:hypothetical protein
MVCTARPTNDEVGGQMVVDEREAAQFLAEQIDSTPCETEPNISSSLAPGLFADLYMRKWSLASGLKGPRSATKRIQFELTT